MPSRYTPVFNEMSKKYLKEAGPDWGPLPFGLNPLNASIRGLEVAGLVEIRINADYNPGLRVVEWRLKK